MWIISRKRIITDGKATRRYIISLGRRILVFIRRYNRKIVSRKNEIQIIQTNYNKLSILGKLNTDPK